MLVYKVVIIMDITMAGTNSIRKIICSTVPVANRFEATKPKYAKKFVNPAKT